MNKTKIAIFVSGRGSNAKAIIEQQNNFNYEVALLISSKKDALALAYAEKQNIPTLVLDKNEFQKTDNLLSILNEHKIQLMALAGFLWMIPQYLIKAFPNKIVNIHPALLPKYGGKGMYGIKVHEAVVENKEAESGITIHLVNEKYDEGKILFQEAIPLSENETAASLSKKILVLEHKNFAPVLNKLC